jgi:hypothetical protein
VKTVFFLIFFDKVFVSPLSSIGFPTFESRSPQQQRRRISILHPAPTMTSGKHHHRTLEEVRWFGDRNETRDGI